MSRAALHTGGVPASDVGSVLIVRVRALGAVTMYPIITQGAFPAPFFGIIRVGLIAVIRTRALGQLDQSIVITQRGLLPGLGSFPIYFLEFPGRFYSGRMIG